MRLTQILLIFIQFSVDQDLSVHSCLLNRLQEDCFVNQRKYVLEKR